MTKSYNYIPTHFLYSSLLFFLLIFMYQLTHCLTLPKPFSKIFFFRIYVPTTYTHQPCLTSISPRPASGLHRYTRQPSPRKPIHQRHCPHPHIPQIPRPYSLHNHTASTTIQPPQPHSLHNHTASTTTQPPQPHSLHNHTASTNTHTHATPSPDDVVDASRSDAIPRR